MWATMPYSELETACDMIFFRRPTAPSRIPAVWGRAMPTWTPSVQGPWWPGKATALRTWGALADMSPR